MPDFILSDDAKLGIIAVIIIPMMIANTGAPIISKEKEPNFRSDRNVETAATTAAIKIPRPFVFTKSIDFLL